MAGNTFFPSFLRLTIWITVKIVPAQSSLHQSLTFLLHHPRRCFILLFPSINTWYLTAIQAALHFLLWIFWILLQIDYPTIENIPPGNRTISGLFQALGIRTSGLYIISMSNIAPALLVLYTAAMYISALPIIISIRSTNVYEERSLGVQKKEKSDDEFGSERSYIGVGTILKSYQKHKETKAKDEKQKHPANPIRPILQNNSPPTPGGFSSPSSSSASSSATHFPSPHPASTSTPSSSKPFPPSVSSA